MTDVQTADPATTASDKSRSKQQGSHIWYELMTTDPVAAKVFYEAIVPGWTIGERNPGDLDYRMIGRSDGGNAGGVLGLSQSDVSQGARPIWMGYISVDDVDATVTQIEAKGGKSIMSAFEVPGVGRIAMVADPQGNPFYVMKPITPPGAENQKSDAFSPTEEQRVSWNELTTSDPAAARAFYGDLFGWTSDEFMPMGELGEYRFFAHNGTTIGAVCQPGPDGSSGWRYYIRVPSISKAVGAVKAGGGTITLEPMEVPGGDHIIIGNDLQGAEFALVGKA